MHNMAPTVAPLPPASPRNYTEWLRPSSGPRSHVRDEAASERGGLARKGAAWSNGAMPSSEPPQVLFIGGRSGVGKTSVALAASAVLADHDVAHAVIEGDYLDLAYPEPWREGIDLAEQNLGAVWRNYRRAGYSRLIYTNTVSVLQMEVLMTAMGGGTRGTGVLLTASDETARARLQVRESGAQLQIHLERSRLAAQRLDAEAPVSVIRVPTDGRSISDVGGEVARLTGWLRS